MKNVNFFNRIKQKLVGAERNTSLPLLHMLVIADLHGYFPLDMKRIQDIKEDYDCVCLLGDIPENAVREIVQMMDVPCFYVLGNHDTSHQNESIEGLTSLDGNVVEINGIRLGGASGAPRYKKGDFCMRSEEEIEEELKNIGKVDVLITHESPYHLMTEEYTHSGYKAISNYIQENRPIMHIFGHHHRMCEGMYKKTKEYCIYRVAIVSTDYTVIPIF